MLNPQYQTDWMMNAIPMDDASKLSKCHRYAPVNITSDQVSAAGYCTADAFDRAEKIACEQDGLIYRTDEISIVNAVFK